MFFLDISFYRTLASKAVPPADGTTGFGLNYSYQQNSANNCTSSVAGDNGQIQCIEDVSSTTITPGANGRSVSYTYDALGRLSSTMTTGSTQFPQWGLAEAFDQYGNRLSQTVTAGSGPPSSLSFANPGGAQTNQPDGWCFDLSGNLLSKTASPCPPGYPSFVYDGEDQMTSAPPSGVSYVYDGNGTRVERCLPNCTSPTSWTAYLFSGSWVIAEYDNGAAVNQPSREFIYSDAVPGSGLLASITSGSTLTYFHSDHLDWRVSTNASGQIVGQQEQYPYGESWYSQNGNEFAFTSYSRDTATNLDYAMARYYDSSAGRFDLADPVGGSRDDPQSWNRYAYVRNDPVDITDPSGQNWLIDLMDFALGLFSQNHSVLGGTPGQAPPFGIPGGPSQGTIWNEQSPFGGGLGSPGGLPGGMISNFGEAPAETARVATITCIFAPAVCAAIAAAAAEAVPYVAAAGLAAYLGHEMLHPKSVDSGECPAGTPCPYRSSSKDTAGSGPFQGKDTSTQAGREDQLAGVNATRDTRTKAAGANRRLGYRIDSSGSKQKADKGLRDMQGKSLGEIEKEEEGQ